MKRFACLAAAAFTAATANDDMTLALYQNGTASWSNYTTSCNGQDDGCPTPMKMGDGDCDRHSDCGPGLNCGTDNCWYGQGSPFDNTDDCCFNPQTMSNTQRFSQGPKPSTSFCAGQEDGCPYIGEADGDCENGQCVKGLKCGLNNCWQGQGSPFDNTDDCCYNPSQQNSAERFTYGPASKSEWHYDSNALWNTTYSAKMTIQEVSQDRTYNSTKIVEGLQRSNEQPDLSECLKNPFPSTVYECQMKYCRTQEQSFRGDCWEKFKRIDDKYFQCKADVLTFEKACYEQVEQLMTGKFGAQSYNITSQHQSTANYMETSETNSTSATTTTANADDAKTEKTTTSKADATWNGTKSGATMLLAGASMVVASTLMF